MAGKVVKDVPTGEEEEKYTLGDDILLLSELMAQVYEIKKRIEIRMGLHKERGQKTDSDVPSRIRALIKAFNEENEIFLIEGIDSKVFVVWPMDSSFSYKLENRIFVHLGGVRRKNPDNTKPLGYDEIDYLKQSLAIYLEKGLGIEEELRATGGKIVIKMPGEYSD